MAETALPLQDAKRTASADLTDPRKSELPQTQAEQEQLPGPDQPEVQTIPNPEQQQHYDENEPQLVQYKVKRRPKSMRKKVARRQQPKQEQGRNAADWDNRFYVTASCNNGKLHQFFREYFDKKPKQIESSFRVKYANSTNELPGITDVGSRTHTKVKEFRSLPEKAHMNVKKLMAETRMPLKKGQSSAYPSAKKHFRLAEGWQKDFTVMQSRANDTIYKGKREFFDQPVMYQTGMNTNKTNSLKPMEVYHKITPVRSIQQSINLIRALKNEQKEEVARTRPKSVAMALGSYSDNYGQIPNLRDSVDKDKAYLPTRQMLQRFDQQAYSTSSPGRSKNSHRFMTQGMTPAQQEMAGITATSWERIRSENVSMAEVNNPQGTTESQQMLATTGALTSQSKNFMIRNHRRRTKKRRHTTSKKAPYQTAQPILASTNEYGLDPTKQPNVSHLNQQSHGELRGGNGQASVNARASQEAINPMTMGSIEKPVGKSEEMAIHQNLPAQDGEQTEKAQ